MRCATGCDKGWCLALTGLEGSVKVALGHATDPNLCRGLLFPERVRYHVKMCLLGPHIAMCRDGLENVRGFGYQLSAGSSLTGSRILLGNGYSII
jgi:hypothetical protein